MILREYLRSLVVGKVRAVLFSYMTLTIIFAWKCRHQMRAIAVGADESGRWKQVCVTTRLVPFEIVLFPKPKHVITALLDWTLMRADVLQPNMFIQFVTLCKSFMTGITLIFSRTLEACYTR